MPPLRWRVVAGRDHSLRQKRAVISSTIMRRKCTQIQKTHINVVEDSTNLNTNTVEMHQKSVNVNWQVGSGWRTNPDEGEFPSCSLGRSLTHLHRSGHRFTNTNMFTNPQIQIHTDPCNGHRKAGTCDVMQLTYWIISRGSHFVFKTSSIRETYIADKDLRAGGYLRMISEKLKSRTQTKEGRSSIIRTPTITQERSDLPSGGKSNVTKPTIASHLKNPNCVTDHCCNLNIVITTFNISNQI